MSFFKKIEIGSVISRTNKHVYKFGKWMHPNTNRVIRVLLHPKTSQITNYRGKLNLFSFLKKGDADAGARKTRDASTRGTLTVTDDGAGLPDRA